MHAVLVPVYLLLVTPITLSWWASGSQLVMEPRMICKRTRRLRGRLADICNKPDLMNQIAEGIRRGQLECQYQFRHRKWNCTSARRSIRKVLLRDTRETGFVNAMLSAGVTFQVTRACTTGELKDCSCDKRIKKHHNKKNKLKNQKELPPEAAAVKQDTISNWEWEGCGGDNVEFGIKKSKDFLDTRYRRRGDMKTLVKLHNYVAGRLAIKNHMRKDCKCHGLSGSCTMRTCWRKIAPFREIGNLLKERFDGAVKVIAGNDGHSFMPEGDTIKPPMKGDLVYSEESPSFCTPNTTLGSFGTQGRSCNASSQAEDGCAILCCGRGHATTIKTETRNCKCKFEWCCEVKCEKCNVEITKTTCL